MKINKKISVGMSIVFITILCVGCSNRVDSKSQTTEKTTLAAFESNTEPFIVLKNKIHPSLPEYIFKVYGQKKDGLFSASKISIYNKDDKEDKLQELVFNETSTPDGEQLGIVIEDMNFDGYKDIRIQQLLPATGNVPYYYWLWDKEISKFIKNNELEKITSPVFDAKSKSIKSNVKEDATTYYDYEYKYINNKITLIKEIQRIGNLEKNVWNITVKELVNNEMKVIKKYEEEIK
ncbi:MAG: XAC2610-related protein [Clostridium sp.]|uniref:XAC2610-related protein n=1 Tax=Clostridium sp. TaxID=1506 RepID=UPI003D6C8C78